MSDNARKSFMEGTIRQVAAVGIENLRTKNIAEETNYSEATLFREFKSKEDLLCCAFLEVDKRISDLLTESPYIKTTGEMDFSVIAFSIWRKVFRYLVAHPEETLFLIRFRYSSLYTDEIRSKRQAYNGSFEPVYDVIVRRLGTPTDTYRGFLINYVFELTLSFAEKVVTGRIKDSEEMEVRLWSAISGAITNMISEPKHAEN